MLWWLFIIFIVIFLDIGFRTITKLSLSNILLLLFILSQIVFWDHVLALILDAVFSWTLDLLLDKVFLLTFTFDLSLMLLWKFDRLMFAIVFGRWIGVLRKIFWWLLYTPQLPLALVFILYWHYLILPKLFLGCFVCLIFLAAVHEFEEACEHDVSISLDLESRGSFNIYYLFNL